MKILRKKSLIILLSIIVLINVIWAYKFYSIEKDFYSPKKEYVSVTNKLTDEKIRQKYIEILSCVPEKPIDEKVLFAEAMKQYWQYRMNKLLEQDKMIKDDWTYQHVEPFSIVEFHCGLKFDKKGKSLEITKETCYPWIVPYKNLEELFQDIHKIKFEWTHGRDVDTAFRKRMYSLNAKPYKPEIDDNIYLSNQNFSIIKRDNVTDTVFYPADCCRLISYQGIDIDKKNDEKHKPHNAYSEYIVSLLPNQVLDKIYFLEIKRQLIDRVRDDQPYEGLGENLRTSNYEHINKFLKETKGKYGYYYYPISLCGKGVFSPN
ncbi:MAG: hypothetical protein IK065_06505 [Neisseriaceae bacterium]|nr:hypothetical protein [Neisseriaceae bacterium]